MKDSRFRYYFLLVATVVVGGLVGAAIAKAVSGEGLKADVIANLAVAIGTLALAIITFVSVMKTNDVIAGEDRRHQIGYAPFVVVKQRMTEGRSLRNAYIVPTEYLVLYNQGLGIATDIEVRFASVSEPAVYGVLAVGDEGVFKPPKELAVSFTIRYRDMFENQYQTDYSKVGDYTEPKWKRPKNLQPVERRFSR